MATLKISPSGGPVGSTVGLKGSGYAKHKKYKLIFAGSQVGEFETTATGAIPRGAELTVPDAATSGEKGELGTVLRISAITHDGGEPAAVADFLLHASMSLDATAASIGFNVKVSARGLLANEFYSITSILGEKPDVTVGVFTTGPKGDAESEFTVTSALAPGDYQIQIKNRRGFYMALRDASPLKLRGYSNESLVPGKPTGPVSQPYCTALVTIPFTNKMVIPTTATVYALILNEDGEVIRLTSSGINLSALGSAEMVICFGTLELGRYTVSAFAANNTGAVLSKTFTFPLNISVPPKRRKRIG